MRFATIVPPHVARAAHERAVVSMAGLRAVSAGLSPIQTEALCRYARERFRSGHVSPARAADDTRVLLNCLRAEAAQ